MKRTRNIYSVGLGLGLLLLISGCGNFGRAREEVTSRPKEAPVDTRRFDPLDLPQDTVIVPLQAASPGAVITQHRAALLNAQSGRPGAAGVDGDTLYSQVFRVQLVTCETYGEGRAALRVAGEIFDQPVYMDYDVPYFKVRVGDFATRGQAEAYQKKAVAAGYVNAWVVAVTVTSQNVPVMYQNSPVTPPADKGQADSLNGVNH